MAKEEPEVKVIVKSDRELVGEIYSYRVNGYTYTDVKKLIQRKNGELKNFDDLWQQSNDMIDEDFRIERERPLELMVARKLKERQRLLKAFNDNVNIITNCQDSNYLRLLHDTDKFLATILGIDKQNDEDERGGEQIIHRHIVQLANEEEDGAEKN